MTVTTKDLKPAATVPMDVAALSGDPTMVGTAFQNYQMLTARCTLPTPATRRRGM